MSSYAIHQLVTRLNNTYVEDQKIGMKFKIDRTIDLGDKNSTQKWKLSILCLNEISKLSFMEWNTIIINHSLIIDLESIDVLLFLCSTVVLNVILHKCIIDYKLLCQRARNMGCYYYMKRHIMGIENYIEIAYYESESS